jgi:polyferredoxin
MVPLEKVKKETEAVKKELKEKTLTLILGGFGLVAALAWNEAIKSLFETLLPKSSALIGKFAYAIIVTVIVVFISYFLRKVSQEK